MTGRFCCRELSDDLSYRGPCHSPTNPPMIVTVHRIKTKLLNVTPGPVPSPQPCPEANYMLLPQRTTCRPQPRPTSLPVHSLHPLLFPPPPSLVSSWPLYCCCFLREALPNPTAPGVPLPCADQGGINRLDPGWLSTRLPPTDLGAWPGAFL